MKKAILTPSIPAIILLLLLLLLPEASMAEPREQTVKLICGTQPQNNITIFGPNFIATMENISAQTRTAGFGTTATGSEPNTAHGLAQCYGDLSTVDCILCHAGARAQLARCYPANGGRVYLDGCFMRYENYSFYNEYVTAAADHAVCGNTTRLDSAFQETARRAVARAASAAPYSDGYARAEVAVPGAANDSAYVLADCWRSINASACRHCLENASALMSGCLPSSEGRALNTGCFMRYSDIDFLNPVPSNGNARGRVIGIAIAAVGAAAVLIVGVAIGVYMWKNRIIQKKREGDAEKLLKILNDRSLNFKYSTLDKATDSFSEANKIGQGGFGTVYKGIFADGREIAVKRLYLNNKHRAADFYNEVNIISSVEHKNLVRLLGCSCLGPESLLVYEFLPNMSLDRFIFSSSKGIALNWEKRFEIIIGTAEGLVYLHENANTRIIHRDIKASNILLDSRLRAKIADFGLARTFQESKSHISTAIAGTLGYMAPEYLAFGHLTEKADVYSFGVLLLEIVTGRQNNRSQNSECTDKYNADSLLDSAWMHFQKRTLSELIDPNLMLHNYHNANTEDEILRAVHVGLLCTQESTSLRPSMFKALQMLVGKEYLPEPTSPPFMDDMTMEVNEIDGSTPALDHSNAASVATISHSIFYPR